MKKSFKNAMVKSLKEETDVVQDRFAKADSIFGTEESAVKTEREKIEKVIRDTFTLPEKDYQLIDLIRERALKSSLVLSKSEVIRVGLLALKDMSQGGLIDVVKSLTKVKSGRPSAKRKE